MNNTENPIHTTATAVIEYAKNFEAEDFLPNVI